VSTFYPYVWNNWSCAYIQWVLGFNIKTGYDRSDIRAVSNIGTLAYIEESFPKSYFEYLQKYFILISRICFWFTKSNFNGYVLLSSSLFLDGKGEVATRKHVHAPPRKNVVPMESHSDGQRVGYFPRTLRTRLLALGYIKAPLFIGVPRLLRGNLYLWRVRVIIY
jgi:hypothetical protein